MASFLGGGAECSTSNPLSQLTKNSQQDNTLQRDRLVANAAASSSVAGFRANTRSSTPQDGQMRSFLQQPPSMPEMPLDQLHRPVGRFPIDPVQHVLPQPSSASPASFSPAPFSPSEFAKFQRASSRSSPVPGPSMTMPARQDPLMGIAYPSQGVLGVMQQQPLYNSLPALYSPQASFQPQHVGFDTKGKAVARQPDEEAQMKAVDRAFEEMSLFLDSHHDESLAMEPELDKMDQKILESETGFGDFESIWQGIQNGEAAMKTMPDEDLDIKWGDGIDSWGAGGGRVSTDPIIEEYLFEEDNLFKDHPNPFEEGVRIMDEGGNLSLAALAFEAAVQKDSSHIEAWVRLGSAQAQNEKEDAALRALQRVLQLDPNNLDALMGLAVSYTNEGYDSTAYRTLERWLSVKYPQVVSPGQLSDPADMGFTDRAQLHDKVTDLFIQAAQLSPDGERMDPDVQVGLGVLFYGSEDFPKAVDCFRAALASSEAGTTTHRSQIHLLWNRLGATLANSGKSEDAIQAYEQALALRPNFVRARYNLGVSCMNIGCHEQAAAHLLSALDMHKSVEKSGREKARELLSATGDGSDVSDEHLDRMTTQNRSTTLYDTLRRVFTLMGRRDLSEKVVFGVDPEIFRPEFEF